MAFVWNHKCSHYPLSFFDCFLYKHSNLLVLVHFTPFFYYLVAIYHHLFSGFCKNLQTHLPASRLLSSLCSHCTRKSISELISNLRFPYLKSFSGALLPSRESPNPSPHLVKKGFENDLYEARAISTISICLCLSPFLLPAAFLNYFQFFKLSHVLLLSPPPFFYSPLSFFMCYFLYLQQFLLFPFPCQPSTWLYCAAANENGWSYVTGVKSVGPGIMNSNNFSFSSPLLLLLLPQLLLLLLSIYFVQNTDLSPGRKFLKCCSKIWQNLGELNWYKRCAPILNRSDTSKVDRKYRKYRSCSCLVQRVKVIPLTYCYLLICHYLTFIFFFPQRK